MTNEYTQVCNIEKDGFDIFQCNDCGAHADNLKGIVHHKSCKPGEAKHWKDIYSKEV